MRLFLILSLLLVSANAFYRKCENGATKWHALRLGLDVCQCAPGYHGDKCQFKCVHGTSACEQGWVGTFCNITKETVCLHGQYSYWSDCVCDSGWTGAKCDQIECEGDHSVKVSSTECKCTHSGTYPDCKPPWFKRAGCWGLAIIVVLVVGFGIGYHHFESKKKIGKGAVPDPERSPKDKRKDDPPSYPEAVGE